MNKALKLPLFVILAFLLFGCLQRERDISSYISCPKNQLYTGSWTMEKNGIRFEAFLCPDSTLIAVFYNQEFPDPITINQKEWSSPEYAWDVYIDVDSIKQTGLSETETTAKKQLAISGADYILSRSHISEGKEETVPFSQIVTNVMVCDSNIIRLSSYAEGYSNKEEKVIVLRGEIPGINANSKISFSRFNLSDDNKLTYHTDWITFIPSP